MPPSSRTQGREMHPTSTAGRNDSARRWSWKTRSKSSLLGCLVAAALSAPAGAKDLLAGKFAFRTMSIWTRRPASGSIRQRHRASHRPLMGASARLSRRERPRCYAPARAGAAAIWCSTRRRRATASERMRRTPSSLRRVRPGARPLSPGAGPPLSRRHGAYRMVPPQSVSRKSEGRLPPAYPNIFSAEAIKAKSLRNLVAEAVTYELV